MCVIARNWSGRSWEIQVTFYGRFWVTPKGRKLTQMPGIERFPRSGPAGALDPLPVYAVLKVEGSTFRTDRLTADQDQLRIGFTLLLNDRNGLPFCVQTAILVEVDGLSAATHKACRILSRTRGKLASRPSLPRVVLE